jgi:hypothetical protein
MQKAGKNRPSISRTDIPNQPFAFAQPASCFNGYFMSIVIAAKFLDRIVVFSDTMISDVNMARSNIIPGQLKSVVLNGKLSISYARSVSTGLDVIQQSETIFSRTQDLGEVVKFARHKNNSLLSTEWACDFIIVSHVQGPCMYRIYDGKISYGADRYWIGDHEPIRKCSETENAVPVPADLKFFSPEEYKFRRAIHSLLFEPAVHTASGVGGFMFELLGSPFGHCYGNHATAKYWDTVQFPPGVTARQAEDRASGMTLFGYCTVASLERGAGVVGAFIEQTQTGYIYRPSRGEPQRLFPCTLDQIDSLVTAYAKEMGGFVDKH